MINTNTGECNRAGLGAGFCVCVATLGLESNSDRSLNSGAHNLPAAAAANATDAGGAALKSDAQMRTNSKSKKWSGGDQRHHKQHKLKASKGKVSKDGHWRERASSKHVKKAHKLKEAEGSKVKKWRKRKRKKAQHKAA